LEGFNGAVASVGPITKTRGAACGKREPYELCGSQMGLLPDSEDTKEEELQYLR